MDLELEAYSAVLKFRKQYDTRELEVWQRVLTFASPEMEAFEIILSKVEELLLSIKTCEEELSKLTFKANE